MKIYLTILLAVLCLNCCAQKIKIPLSTDSLIQYQEVVKLDTTYTYQLLYKTVKKWFVHNFKSAKSVIQSEDQTNGIFLAKAVIEVHQTGFTLVDNPVANFTIQIDVKQGRYRYNFNSFYLDQVVMNNTNTTNLSDFYINYLHGKLYKPPLQSKTSFDKRINGLLSDFNNQMTALISNLNLEMINSKKDFF